MKSTRDTDFSEPVSVEAPAAETATPDAWAARKGMANRFAEAPGSFVVANPLYQDFAEARAGAGWANDTQVTEEQFDAAVSAAKNHVFR